MTVIAWDGKTLAADKRVSQCGIARTTTKIFRIGELLAGSSGVTNEGAEIIEWVRRGRNPEDFPAHFRGEKSECQVLVVENGICKSYDGSPYAVVYEDSFYATGSGRDYAMAAMACGKSAAEAVGIACRFETGCGNGVDVLEAE
jgi:20S proteasome alpha/beta subunit